MQPKERRDPEIFDMNLPASDALAFEEKVDGKWLPIPRVSRIVPWGYVEDPDDKKRLLPVEFELEALELAKKHLKQYSYRAVANWLSAETGRSISHMGLKKRIENERRRNRQASVYANWANAIEKAREIAKTLKAERVGARQGSE